MELLKDLDIGFIGAGNMAEAIMRGIADRKLIQPANIHVYDPNEERLGLVSEELGVNARSNNRELLRHARLVVFAVKPQIIDKVLEEIAPSSRPHHTFITICAGVPTSRIEKALAGPDHPSPRIVRVMPNTPALIGMGVSGICKGAFAREEDLEVALVLFQSIGKAFRFDETQMDSVTALTGSGPAYVFLMMEALMEAARQQGFGEEEAGDMVRHLVLGAATLASTSNKSPAELRKAVTSPGGTTAAALAVLEERKVIQAFVDCVEAARARGEELGRG